MTQSATRLFDAFVGQDPPTAIAVVEEARAAGVERDDLFDQVFVPAMALLGQAWAAGDIDEVTFAQAAVVAEQLTSFVLPQAAVADTGVTVIVGCLAGETHSIGRNMVVAALKEAGHRVIDLGVDTRAAVFLEKVEETGARLLVVCAEMMGTAEAAGDVRDLLSAGGHDEVLMLACGGPFDADPALAKRLGMNGVIQGAESAMRLVERIARERLGGGAP